MSTGADIPAVSGDERVYVNVSNPLLRPYRTGSYLIYDQGVAGPLQICNGSQAPLVLGLRQSPAR